MVKIRKEIDRAIRAKDASLARALMAELWSTYPGPASAPIILSGFNALDDLDKQVGAELFNVCLLRSFTAEPIIPILKAASSLAHIRLNLNLGQFNTYCTATWNW